MVIYCWESEIFNEAGFKGASAHSQGEFSYDSIGKMVASAKGFLIYQYPLSYWIPRHAFAALSESDRFEEAEMTKSCGLMKRYHMFETS
jgi:hypothetical protein